MVQLSADMSANQVNNGWVVVGGKGKPKRSKHRQHAISRSTSSEAQVGTEIVDTNHTTCQLSPSNSIRESLPGWAQVEHANVARPTRRLKGPGSQHDRLQSLLTTIAECRCGGMQGLSKG